jgi:hypothetical protein
MALNKQKFLIKDFVVSRGSLDVNDQFSGSVFSYSKTGDSELAMAKEYAQFFNNVPQGLIRQDLTSKTVSFKFSCPQFEQDKLELLFGAKLVADPNYPNHYKLAVGADELTTPEEAWLLAGETVDGKEFSFIIRKGRVLPESANITVSGSDHAVVEIMIQAFEDENLPRDENYGFFLVEKDAS